MIKNAVILIFIMSIFLGGCSNVPIQMAISDKSRYVYYPLEYDSFLLLFKDEKIGDITLTNKRTVDTMGFMGLHSKTRYFEIKNKKNQRVEKGYVRWGYFKTKLFGADVEFDIAGEAKIKSNTLRLDTINGDTIINPLAEFTINGEKVKIALEYSYEQNGAVIERKQAKNDYTGYVLYIGEEKAAYFDAVATEGKFPKIKSKKGLYVLKDISEDKKESIASAVLMINEYIRLHNEVIGDKLEKEAEEEELKKKSEKNRQMINVEL